MKIVTLSSMLILFCLSCKETKELNTDSSNAPAVEIMASNEYLIFGTYAGSCMGDCVDLFKLTPDALYKDRSKKRPYQESFFVGDFEKLPETKYQKVSALLGGVNPLQGKSAGDTYGCPDCADQGGIYIEYGKGEDRIKGYLDTRVDALPEELRENANLIKELVSLLREK